MRHEGHVTRGAHLASLYSSLKPGLVTAASEEKRILTVRPTLTNSGGRLVPQ